MRKQGVVIVCFMLLMLTGCIDNRLGDENVKKANTAQNFLNYKQEIDCEWGKLSAVYRGRIYYFQDGKEPGIYSMDTRGKDKQLEIAVQNIRKLQIREEGIYFAGPIEDAPLNQYTLYVKKWGEEKAEEYFRDSFENPYDSQEQNVWDFFINDGTAIVIDVCANIPYMNLNFRAFIVDSEGKAIALENYDEYLHNCTLKGIDENWMSLFGYKDMLFMTKTGLELRIIGDESRTSNTCVIDEDETNMTVFHKGRDEILFFRNQEIYNDRLFDGVLQTIYNGNFIIAAKNNLVWIAEGTEMVSYILELPEVEEIKYSKREGNELLVMARGADNEFVYRISLDSKEIKDVFPIKEEQQVLSAYEGKLYTVSKDALYIYEEGKEGYRETDCKKWKHKLKDTNKLEMAGNVVFVYDVGRDGNRFILKEMQILDK